MLLNILDFLGSPADDKPVWIELLSLIIPIGLAAWGFYSAYRAWERQKKREIELHFEQKRYESELEACRGIWPLLAYLSMWENPKSVFVKHKKTWHFRQAQGEAFLEELPKAFFDSGYGVFIQPEVRDSLYKFRGTVYKLLEKCSHEKPEEGLLKISNADVPEKMMPELFNIINTGLKKMLRDSKIEFGA